MRTEQQIAIALLNHRIDALVERERESRRQRVVLVELATRLRLGEDIDVIEAMARAKNVPAEPLRLRTAKLNKVQ